MGKKLKTGKQRKDKFYHLAKETGYRSRASFKLIQLNRKYEFLQKARVLIDLCAAPGGWLQVAHKYMPVSSFIIGVDLVSIKPVGNSITLQEDITTDSCRKALKRELKTWKADVILHDGAPNVGKSWIHDAFAQAQLTLGALKLASEFLVKGGWFITKVFRSKDYFALIWVLKKLFRKVHATKPKASRTESAEIFVVCQGYVAPDKIDPKFLDPIYLFEDVEQEKKANNLFDAKKKTKAEGYPEGDITLFHSLPATKFIESNNHIELLSKFNEVELDDDEIKNHPLTTDDIKEYCKDIKVLGKCEIRSLLKWRKALRLHFKKEEQSDSKVDQVDQTVNHEDADEEAVLKEANEIQAEKAQELKRKKKMVLKKRRKLCEKMNLNMVIKNDEPFIQEDIELFKLSQIKSKKDLSKVEENPAMIVDDPDVALSGDEQTNMLRRRWLSYTRDEHPEAWPEGADEESHSESSSESDDQHSEKQFHLSDNEASADSGEDENKTAADDEINPLVVDLSDKKKQREELAAKWFEKDTFAEMSDDDDEDLELEIINDISKKKPMVDSAATFTTNHLSEMATQVNDTAVTSVIQSQSETPSLMNELKQKKKKIKLDVMGLALGSLMIESKKKKRDIMDDAYNRYMFSDENLPDWFVKDEEKHYKKPLPVSSEMVAEYKERLKEINARPIKKVVEAKARKKKRAMKRLEKARKKAEAVTESLDMTDREKAEHIRSIYKKALQKKEKTLTYIVAKKGLGKKVKRPPGVKGRFKLVDPRMKKDNRRMKAEYKPQRSGAKKMPKRKKERSSK